MKPQTLSKIFSPSKSMLGLECYQSVLFNDGNWEQVQIELTRKKDLGYTYSYKNPFL